MCHSYSALDLYSKDSTSSYCYTVDKAKALELPKGWATSKPQCCHIHILASRDLGTLCLFDKNDFWKSTEGQLVICPSHHKDSLFPSWSLHGRAMLGSGRAGPHGAEQTGDSQPQSADFMVPSCSQWAIEHRIQSMDLKFSTEMHNSMSKYIRKGLLCCGGGGLRTCNLGYQKKSIESQLLQALSATVTDHLCLATRSWARWPLGSFQIYGLCYSSPYQVCHSPRAPKVSIKIICGKRNAVWGKEKSVPREFYFLRDSLTSILQT